MGGPGSPSGLSGSWRRWGVAAVLCWQGGFQNQFKNGMVLTVLFRHTAASVAELLVAATSAAAAASWQSMWLPLVGQATKGGSGMPEKHSKKPSPFFLWLTSGRCGDTFMWK